ncbi:hypothetical protein [Microbacterium sp. No. 7]|uniref:hypothetical protein n=1 Tax=Microbacterium sp. No. 7 TaxID=1714373 RepID=UPI0006D047A7|nr:hypothetical protein [Microbacterium sp. No. 7]ALJ21625.1 asparagine synthase [Microbacterium sp. No. 7]
MAEKGKRIRSRDVVAEGLYIAAAATRLRLKNEILMHVLADGEDFDGERFVPVARETLLSLADEADAEAERVAGQISQARGKHHSSDGTHDYRSRDVRNLKRRRKQSLHVAQQLRERADDPEELDRLVASARGAAWDEVERNLHVTLGIVAARPDLEPDYARMREARMQSLRLVDLPKLRAARRAAAAHAAE